MMISRVAALAMTLVLPAMTPASSSDARWSVAQAESEGGSIGGTIAPPPQAPAPARRRQVEPVPVRREAAPRRERTSSVSDFDGAWSVSSAGSCGNGGASQVTISGGRVIAPNGSGRVSPSGRVSTLSTYGGVTIVSNGQIRGRTASGVYRRSDGCIGSWSAVKL